MISLVGYYEMTPARVKASAFEQYVTPDAQLNPGCTSLTVNASLEMARHDIFHPRLSIVTQLLKPTEAALIKRENCEKWYPILKDIHRPIIFVDDILTRNLAMDSPEFNRFLMGRKLCLYYQRRDHVFHPQAVITHSSVPLQLRLWFSGGTPDSTFSTLQHFTSDMNYNSFIDNVNMVYTGLINGHN
jgi:hypothetical protein